MVYWEPEHSLILGVKKLMTEDVMKIFPYVSSYYYEKALEHFGKLKKIYNELSEHTLGKFFVLDIDEVTDLLKNRKLKYIA